MAGESEAYVHRLKVCAPRGDISAQVPAALSRVPLVMPDGRSRLQRSS